MSAIIYVRFSTMEQRKGDSIARQRLDCRALCERNGWTVEAEILDEGRSAYAGKNRAADAALGRFEEEARLGFHSGKTLVVERLDRLSRADPEASYDLIRSLTHAGVSVATVDGSEVYRAGAPLNMIQLLTMFLKAGVAHEESVKKADRIGKARERAREAARIEGRTITRTVPPWIEATRTERRVIEERAEIVRQIFRLADTGFGRTRIVRWLHEHRIAPIGGGGRKSDGWHESFITRTLKNRAVLGEFQPRRGEPILGYYPAIVDAALFERVNAAASLRKEQMGGRKSPKIANLFSGLMKCAHCGGPMRYRQKAAEGSWHTVKGKRYRRTCADASFRCSNAERGGGCENRESIACASLETGVLDALLHLALDDEAFSNRGEVGRLGNMIAERRRTLDLATAKAERLWTAWADDGSPMAKKLAQEAESEAAEQRADIEALERQLASARGRADNAEHLRRVADIRAKLSDADLSVRVPLRQKVALALSTLIESVECGSKGSSVNLVAGAGFLIFDRRGKLAMNFDLVHDGRAQPPVLTDYLRRRGEAKAKGPLFGSAT